ncbi:MAG TPA: transcriptional regulator, partial [Pseudoduganella sp.]
GEELYIVLAALWQWGEQNCFDKGELTYEVIDSEKGLPVPTLQMYSQDGRILGPRDFRIAPKKAQ